MHLRNPDELFILNGPARCKRIRRGSAIELEASGSPQSFAGQGIRRWFTLSMKQAD